MWKSFEPQTTLLDGSTCFISPDLQSATQKNKSKKIFYYWLDCPSPGYYGDYCNMECPQNCQDGYCESVEGACFACKTGHLRRRCTQGRWLCSF